MTIEMCVFHEHVDVVYCRGTLVERSFSQWLFEHHCAMARHAGGVVLYFAHRIVWVAGF